MIYILDSDDNTRKLLAYTLSRSGVEAEAMEEATELFSAIETQIPQLIVLGGELSPEGMSGLEVLARLRSDAVTSNVPVILVSQKDTEYDKIIGLDSGADDYITKPFSIMELLARIRVQQRRGGDTAFKADPASYECGEISVDTASHKVTVSGAAVSLTLKEYNLLCLLLHSRGLVMTRDRILDCIWGYAFDGESRTVDVHIRTLRAKLGAAGHHIETVRGVGYRMI